nr:putative capsid protein [Krahall insect-associated virus 2]
MLYYITTGSLRLLATFVLGMEYNMDTQEVTVKTSGAESRTTTSLNPKRAGKAKGKTGLPKSNVGKQVLNPSPPGTVPQGQYLSKTSTPLSNDPLSEKAYFSSPGSAFLPVATRERICGGTTILPALQNEVYTKLCAVSPMYSKTVPKCGHDYYIAVLTYYRLLKLHKKTGGTLSSSESGFVYQMDDAGFTTVKSHSLFLAGLGDTKIPSGREIYFLFIKPQLAVGEIRLGGREYRIPGYFGPIEENLGAYAGYPCLGVYAQRILQDLWCVEHPRDIDWDLPDGIAFDGYSVNPNCLGYEPATRLSSEQQLFLRGCGLRLTDFQFENQDLPIHFELLVGIHMKLGGTRVGLHPISDLRMGSVGQVPVEVVTSQFTDRAVRAIYRAETSSELPAAEGYLGSTFLYNMHKTEGRQDVIKTLMPVTFLPDDFVGLEARERLDTLYRATTSLVKLHGYETNGFSPTLRLEEVVQLDFTSP